MSVRTLSRYIHRHPLTSDVAVNTVLWMPRGPDMLLVCNRSPHLYLMSMKGEVMRIYSNGKDKGADFVTALVSAHGEFVYGLAEDGNVYCFKSDNGELVHTLRVSEKEVIGMALHPHKNLLATYADDGSVNLWRP